MFSIIYLPFKKIRKEEICLGGINLIMLHTALRYMFTGALLFLLLVLQSCHTGTQNPLIAEWYFTEETFTSLSSPTEDKVLRLYPKGVYTQFGSFGYSAGKWRYNDKGKYIYLHPDADASGKSDIYYSLALLEDKHLKAVMHYKTLNNPDIEPNLCYLRSLRNKSSYDPYSPEMNTWRRPPAKPETEAAIRQRTIDYLRFLKAVYKHALDNDIETLDEDWYPAPILLRYSNKVRMAYSTELSDWNQCFYNYDQAVKGYQLISGQVYDLHIKASSNKFERNLDCVGQILAGLEK